MKNINGKTFKANKEVPDVPVKLSSFHKNCQPQSPCAEFQYPIMVMSHLFYEDLGNISNFIGHLISQQLWRESDWRGGEHLSLWLRNSIHPKPVRAGI